MRAVRNAAGVRQDDMQLSPGFMRKLESGTDTIQFGKVLDAMTEMGVEVSLELPKGLPADVFMMRMCTLVEQSDAKRARTPTASVPGPSRTLRSQINALMNKVHGDGHD